MAPPPASFAEPVGSGKLLTVVLDCAYHRLSACVYD